jgi:transcriptional regulator with XRE-family HTH domain
MEPTTKLRILRLKCGISLNELALHSDLSNQQFSRLELGLAKNTPHNEQLANIALVRVIAARRAALEELEQVYAACEGQLLTLVEENSNEQ